MATMVEPVDRARQEQVERHHQHDGARDDERALDRQQPCRRALPDARIGRARGGGNRRPRSPGRAPRRTSRSPIAAIMSCRGGVLRSRLKTSRSDSTASAGRERRPRQRARPSNSRRACPANEEGRIAAHHEQGAVREVRDVQDAVDERQPERDEAVDAAERQAVQDLLDEQAHRRPRSPARLTSVPAAGAARSNAGRFLDRPRAAVTGPSRDCGRRLVAGNPVIGAADRVNAALGEGRPTRRSVACASAPSRHILRGGEAERRPGMSEGERQDVGARVVPFPSARGRSPRSPSTGRSCGSVLNLYGRMVAEGEWRDYAIDFEPRPGGLLGLPPHLRDAALPHRQGARARPPPGRLFGRRRRRAAC